MADSTRLVLAVDGGQSGTQALLGTDDGTLLGGGHAGPVVHIRTELTAEYMRAALGRAVSDALRGAPRGTRRVDAAYLALTGGAEHASAALANVIDSDSVTVESDVFAAIAAGTAGGPGIGIVAGTGSIAGAVTPDGERLIRGGWGFLVGDEGSGFWIGMQAVRAAAAMTDGVLPAGPLRQAVIDHFAATNMREVAGCIYANLDRAFIAGLAIPIVAAADHRLDPIAIQIARQAGGHLAALTATTARAAGFGAGLPICIVPTGGVLRPGNTVWTTLAQTLARRLPGHRLVRPLFPPVVGAYCLGLQRLGISPADPEIRARLSSSFARLHMPASKPTGALTQQVPRNPTTPEVTTR